MPSPFRSPKTLPEWIELDYYDRPRRLRRLKLSISVLVLLLGVTAITALTFWPRHQLLYQAGPLSTAHAMFNQDCAVCHTDAFKTATRLWPGNVHLHAVSDDACTSCHNGAPHQPAARAEMLKCTECHREHRGRDQLAWIPDGQCTSCHANLVRLDGQPPAFALSIHSFTGDHPEFGFLVRKQPDPGTVRFNHELHLRKDLRDPDGGLANLACVSCHTLDAYGRYMQPVNYDNHCQRCHPLPVQVVLESGDELVRRDAQRSLRDAVRHGLPPAAVDAMVYDRLMQFAETHRAVLEQTPLPPKRPFPGKTITATRYDSPRSWADEQRKQARRQLFEGAAGCRFCHQLKQEADRELPGIEATRIPERWLEHGEFDHAKHRLLDCVACHADAEKSTVSRDVLLPGIGNCRECHMPAVGARSDCVECHRYHNRQDRAARSWHGDRKIPEIISSLKGK